MRRSGMMVLGTRLADVGQMEEVLCTLCRSKSSKGVVTAVLSAEDRESAVEILSGFVKPVNYNNIADSILSLPENEWISILKTYFQPSYFLPSDSEEEEEEEEGEDDGSQESDASETSQAERRCVEREELKEMMRTFGENAWEVFRCAVQNGNMAPFRRITNSETWWL
ncbi:hypothetical protein SUGI_0451980 [Cryptomeria japonica]|nr:hypothetical protein SUGI_0451980 [Cryptomeria japonica]